MDVVFVFSQSQSFEGLFQFLSYLGKCPHFWWGTVIKISGLANNNMESQRSSSPTLFCTTDLATLYIHSPRLGTSGSGQSSRALGITSVNQTAAAIDPV